MKAHRLLRGDVLRFCTHYNGPKFHALLCDAPYHLTSIVKRFGADGAAPAQGGVYARGSRGFMGKRWDGGDLAFQPETWAAFGELMHPGAFGMSFAGSRGWHRMAVAIEDAGFVIHPSIFGWLYGSGFPKATRVKAEEFDGHRYGGQALKPALEPIIVFQKPYAGKPVDSITQTGAGTLNIDAGRIEGKWERNSTTKDDIRGGNYVKGKVRPIECDPQESHPAGRWPSNFALSCLPECNGAHAPGCPVAALDKQSGELTSGTGAAKYATAAGHTGNIYGSESRPIGTPNIEYGDTGYASRFFHRASYRLDHTDPVFYQAKASRAERDEGLGALPLSDSSVGDQRPSGSMSQRIHADTGRPDTVGRNPHPTVKPIELSKWLAALLLPPANYAPRRLFVPFAGVASEMIGAALAGWDEIIGVEGETEYVSIGRARLAHWTRQMTMPLFDLPEQATP